MACSGMSFLLFDQWKNVRFCVCVCVSVRVQTLKQQSGTNVSFVGLSENVCSFLDVQVCHSVLLGNATLQPCSVNGYISMHIFLLFHTLHENPVERENKACPVSICPGDHLYPGNIGSCFLDSSSIKYDTESQPWAFFHYIRGLQKDPDFKPLKKKLSPVERKQKKKTKFSIL